MCDIITLKQSPFRLDTWRAFFMKNITPLQKLKIRKEKAYLSLEKAKSENPPLKSKIKYNETRIRNILKKIHQMKHHMPQKPQDPFIKKFGMFAWKAKQH